MKSKPARARTHSTDGRNWQRVLALPVSEQLGGFALGPGATIHVGLREVLFGAAGAPARLLVSRDGGDGWEPPILSPRNGPRFRCLTARRDRLYACAGGEPNGDDFLLGVSTDGGHRWTPVMTVAKGGEGLARTVRDLTRRAQDLVLDVGAGDSQEMDTALEVADVALVPIQPTGLDVWTLGLIDDRVGIVQGEHPNLTAYVVLNRVSPNPRDHDADEAREALTASRHLRVADVIIHERVAVKRAVPQGLTVPEYTPMDPKVTEEFSRLYTLVFRR